MNMQRRLPFRRGNVIESPHVVILGAGASLAAFPKGDANGFRLPVMRNLASVVGLADLLPESSVGKENYGDFEGLYSRLALSHPGLAQKINVRIAEYFGQMVLPETITLYDGLLL